MSIVRELSPGRPARQFFEKHARAGMHGLLARFDPLKELACPAPQYEHRDGWSVAGEMVDVLIRYSLLGEAFNVLNTPAYAGIETERIMRQKRGEPQTCIAQCLASIAAGNLADQPASTSAAAITAAFALAVGDGFSHSGVWPSEINAIAQTLSGADASEEDVARVTEALHCYWQALGGSVLSDDVAQVLEHWEVLRADAQSDVGQLALVAQQPVLEYGALVGGADPDLLGRFYDQCALLEIKNITGCVSPDHIRQIVAYVLLGGRATEDLSALGFFYSRRGDLRYVPVQTVFALTFGDEDVAAWSARFREHVRQAYTLA